MLFDLVIVAAQRVRPLKAGLVRGSLLAVAASTAVAFAVVSAIPDSPHSAGSAALQRIAEDHALAAESQSRRVEAERAANLAVTQEGARMRELAAARTQTTRVAAVAVPMPRPASAAIAPAEVAGPPLQLHAASVAMPAALPLSRPATSGHPVVAEVRSVVAAVRRIPRWVGAGVINVADWVIEVPAQTIARLPERRFL